MQIHQLKIKPRKFKRRVGRGGKKGTYSGRGMKGQKSRSGASINPIFEGGRSTLIEHLPKVRGFKSIFPKSQVVNLEKLEKYFEKEGVVNPISLHKMKLIGKIHVPVKILSMGKLSKSLTIEKCLVSKSAKEKIEKAGGKIVSGG
jgi:large subunit ribosomal protein L15